MKYWHKDYCRIFVNYLLSMVTFFSKMEHRRIVHVIRSPIWKQTCQTSLNRRTGHQTVLIWTRLTIRSGVVFSNWSIANRYTTLIIWNESLFSAGLRPVRHSWTRPSISGHDVWMQLFWYMVDTLNICSTISVFIYDIHCKCDTVLKID